MGQEKHWQKRIVDETTAGILARDLSIRDLMAKLLVARKITDTNSAQEFLEPRLRHLIEPLLFKDMDKALERITQALMNNETIGIFGDYDVDGVCSAAILVEFLESIQAFVVATLPNRLTEGYGLSRPGIERLRAQGASLLITVDCGIVAHEQIDFANSLGLEVIVVDHHTVSDTLPSAFAIINPKRYDCESQASYLCAASVSFFLCMALRRYLREQGYFSDVPEPDLKKLLDLVALATVCDVVPLVKDNRCLVRAGLQILKQGQRAGLLALMQASGVDPQRISSTNLGFHLGPRINAAGRLEDATKALTLLLCKDAENARTLALELDCRNDERRDIEEETVYKVCQVIEADASLMNARALVIYDESFHPGVVGIVASRIAERYHRPAIIIGEKGKGSGRSIKGIDLYEKVFQAQRSLAGFGGHAHAIGLTLGVEDVEVFREDLLVAMQDVESHVFKQEILYDAEILLNAIDNVLGEELQKLEPFGAQNPYPVLRINHCFMRNLRRLQKGHIKGELETAEGFISFIGFRMDIADDLVSYPLDVLGIVEKNEWQGRVTMQLRLIDYKKSSLG